MFVGWDPVFEVEGKTFAEMDKNAKVDESFQSLPSGRGWIVLDITVTDSLWSSESDLASV